MDSADGDLEWSARIAEKITLLELDRDVPDIDDVIDNLEGANGANSFQLKEI